MEARINIDSKNAVICNDLLALTIDCDSHIRLKSLLNMSTGQEWIPAPPDFKWGTDDHHSALVGCRSDLWPDLAPPSSEFLLEYTPANNNESLVPSEQSSSIDKNNNGRIQLTGADAGSIVSEHCCANIENSTAHLTIAMTVPGHPLEIVVNTEIYDGLPIVRRWTTVTNTGNEPFLLHKLTSLMCSVRPGYSDLDLYWIEVFKHEQMLWRQCAVHQERITAAVRRKLLSGPYSRPHDGSNGSMAWAALRDPVLDEGLFIGWEWSGIFDTEIGDFREGAGVFGIRAGFSNDNDYARKLEPGESFTTPKAFIGFYRGDVEEAARATKHAAEKLYALPWPEKQAPMFIGYDTWNNWQDFDGKITNHLRPERLDREIEICKKLGVELFILDYDWFPRLGDFWSDPERFPDGVEAVSAKVKAAGMRFGLWMGFGQVHAQSQVAREHPEWLVTENSTAVNGGWSMRSLCLGYPPCRDWVLEQVSRVVKDFGVEWLKHDFDLIPISDAHHHAPNATDSRIETVMGYYYIMEQLHNRFPNLYLDNWTPATGGADFGNFQRHHSSLVADWYGGVDIRSALNGITHLIPNNRTHAYLRTFSKEDERNPYYYRSGSFGNGMYLLNDILQWDDETIKIAQDEIAHIKADRELFSDGETYTLIPKQPDRYGWEARFVYSDSLGQGMAQIFRNHDPDEERLILLRGLDPDAMYDIEFVSGVLGFANGNELMTEGIRLHLETPFSSDIIRIKRRR